MGRRPERSAESCTILVVEDHELVRRALCRGLRRCGYGVREAADSFDAMMVCVRQRIDLLLTDIVLPGLSGFELAHRLLPAYPAMKVLFLSAADRYLGDSDVLPKPITTAALDAAVRRVLRL
jgi:DNA-binding response OmpR family regulator